MKPLLSSSQARLCRNTRTVLNPKTFSAQPNSISIKPGSNVSSCHMVSSFWAFDGMKFEPAKNVFGSWLHMPEEDFEKKLSADAHASRKGTLINRMVTEQR